MTNRCYNLFPLFFLSTFIHFLFFLFSFKRKCKCLLDTSINIAAVIRTIGSLINRVLNFLSAPFQPLINQIEKVIDNIMDKAINALERKFNKHFNLDKLLVVPQIMQGLKKKAEDQIRIVTSALPFQEVFDRFAKNEKAGEKIPKTCLTAAAKNAAKNAAKQSTPSNSQQSNSQQSSSLDAKLVDGYPYLKWTDGKYHPICGHYFWDKQRGADLFCNRAGYAPYTKIKSNVECTSGDQHLGKFNTVSIQSEAVSKCSCNYR